MATLETSPEANYDGRTDTGRTEKATFRGTSYRSAQKSTYTMLPNGTFLDNQDCWDDLLAWKVVFSTKSRIPVSSNIMYKLLLILWTPSHDREEKEKQAGAELGQAQLPTGIWLYCD